MKRAFVAGRLGAALAAIAALGGGLGGGGSKMRRRRRLKGIGHSVAEGKRRALKARNVARFKKVLKGR